MVSIYTMERNECKDIKRPGVVSAVLLFMPTLVLAGDLGNIDNFARTIVLFINNTFIPLIFAFGLLAFLWGMVRYFILGGADEEKRAQGRALIFHSILGFVLMITVLAIVNLFASGLLEALGMPNDLIIGLPRAEF